jgi:HEAT repeat protein
MAITFSLFSNSPGQEKSGAEKLQELHSSRTIRIVIEENYGDAAKVSLPVKDFLEPFIRLSGLVPVEAGGDITLHVNLKGRASARTYRSGKTSQKAYTGARIRGTVSIKKEEREFISKSFRGNYSRVASTRYGSFDAILKGSYQSPSDAPFKTAFAQSTLSCQLVEVLAAAVKNPRALLTAYLNEPDLSYRARAAAARCLGNYGSPGAVETLLHHLMDPASEVRQAVIGALNKIDKNWQQQESCKRLLPSFLKGFKSEDFRLRLAAVDVFGVITYQPARKLLLDALKDESSFVRRGAERSLNRNYPDWKSSPEAAELSAKSIARLNSDSYEERKAAIHALEKTGGNVLEPLIAALSHPSYVTREAVFQLLEKKYEGWSSHPKAAEQAPFFVQQLQSKSVKLKRQAVDVLTTIKAPVCMNALIEILPSAYYEKAFKSLQENYPQWERSPKAVEQVPLLIEELKSDSGSKRKLTIEILGVIKDQRSVPILIQFLNGTQKKSRWISGGERENIKRAAIEALAGIDTPDMVEVEPLLREVVNEDYRTRASAVTALGNKKGDRVIQVLISALQDKYLKVKLVAVRALGKQQVSRAIQPLIDLVKKSLSMRKQSVKKIRESVFQVLDTMDDEFIASPLVELLNVDNQTILKAAKQRLAKITDPAAAKILMEYLQDNDAETRRFVIWLLGKLKYKPAIKPLIECLDTSDKLQKKNAWWALKWITGRDYGVKYKKWKKWWNKTRAVKK